MNYRYEVYCGGRLLKVVQRVDVTPIERDGEPPTEFIDAGYLWMVDQKCVAADVAQAMLATYGDAQDWARSPWQVTHSDAEHGHAQ